ncbi:MAG: Zinc-binding dehydrogenase [Acidobacteria bacterium]|jgi:NADPH2:quinone reductase|nr:Zinc-binding dehydrogenase [Acidobacteriota bacterium]
MKAIRIHKLGGAENLSFDEVEKPTPGAGEVTIKTAAAGVNFADIMLRQGNYFYRPELPFTPGFEVAGTIEEVGAGVENWRAGQRVLAMNRSGGYAEYALADAKTLLPIPEILSFSEATALLVQGLTALGLLVDLKAGQTILIHAAAGGVGSLLVQLAKLKGAKVLGTASSAEKLEKIVNLGADAAINYTEADWTEQVLQATGGKGADLIIEMVGGEIGRSNLECLATRGTMIVYGAASGEDFSVSVWNLLSNMQTIKGYNLNLESAENIAQFSRELTALVGEKKLQVIVQEYPLEKASDAHTAIESRKTTGKVVLTIA